MPLGVKNWPGRRNRLPHLVCKPLHGKEGGADGFVCRAKFSHLLTLTVAASNHQARLDTQSIRRLGGFGDFLPADQMYKSDWPNFAPRLGFSWALGSDRKTV